MSIYHYSSGKRIENTHPAYKKIVEKIESDYPGFTHGETNITIEAKRSLFTTRQRYVGNTESEARLVGSGSYPPPAQILTQTGEYLDDDGNKQQVLFSDGPPRFDKNGVPDYPTQEPISISDGFHLSNENMDKVVFLYGMKPEIDGGVYKRPDSRHEFSHPELKAKNKRMKSIEVTLAEEILYEGTCMTYGQVKSIMTILSMPLSRSENEDVDRETLYNMIVSAKDKSMYEKAKLSAIQNKQSSDPETIAKTVNKAIKAEMLFQNEKTGRWNLKKQTGETIEVCEISGDTEAKKKFTLGEFYGLNPVAFDELASLTK